MNPKSNERQYLRIPVVLSARIERISEREAATLISQGSRPSPVTQIRHSVGELIQKGPYAAELRRFSDRLVELILGVDQKLDTLMERLSSDRGLGVFISERSADISGRGLGIRMSLEECAKAGLAPAENEYVRLTIFLLYPAMNRIHTIASVRRVIPGTDGPTLGLEFDSIADEDREEIVRAVRVQEQAMLEARRREKDQSS